MNTTKKILLAAAAMIAFPIVVASAQSAPNPLEIKQYTRLAANHYQSDTLMLKITSMADKIDLQSVTLNRGNCKLGGDGLYIYAYQSGEYYLVDPGYNGARKSKEELKSEGWEEAPMSGFGANYRKIGVTLKFGDVREFPTTCSRILELAIKTNLGEFRFGG